MENLKLGPVLKDLRKSAGVSQREVAERIGTTDKAVSSYETGRVEPPLSALFEMLQLYGASLTDLELLLDETSEDQNGDAHNPLALAEVGPCLAVLRERSGFSHEALAQSLDWSIDLVKKVEQRNSNPRIREVGQFLHALGYTLWDLAQAFDFVAGRPLRQIDSFIDLETEQALESPEVRRFILELTKLPLLEKELAELRQQVFELHGADQADEDRGDNGKDT